VTNQRRGFASMDREKRHAIAVKGGIAAHAHGTAHEWTCDEAREAGHRGGTESARRRAVRHEAPDTVAAGSDVQGNARPL